MSSSLTVYTPESPLRHPGPLLADLFRDLVASHRLAWPLFIRDFSAQYRQTYLGYLWAFLPPLAASGTFIFLESQGIVQVGFTGVPYVVFAMVGTTLWQTFVDAVQGPTTAVQNAKPMLAKVNFPREAVLLSGVYMVICNFLIRLAPLALIMALWRVAPAAGVFFFPITLLGLIACGTAVGLLLLPLGGLYGDISRSIPIVTQFWMLLTPVVYPVRTSGKMGWLATWNPVASVLTTARESLTGGAMSQLPGFVTVSLTSIVLCFLGVLAYRLVMPLLIERMGG
jgi:lipopolysaccharide transport system permease protein